MFLQHSKSTARVGVLLLLNACCPSHTLSSVPCNATISPSSFAWEDGHQGYHPLLDGSVASTVEFVLANATSDAVATVCFTGGTFLLDRTILFNTPVHITGESVNSTVLQGDNKFGLLFASQTSGMISVSKMTLTGGNDTHGGCLFSTALKTIVSDCSFSRCYSQSSFFSLGGAVAVLGFTYDLEVVVEDSMFQECNTYSARGFGGAVAVAVLQTYSTSLAGTPEISFDVNVTLQHNTFIRNNAIGAATAGGGFGFASLLSLNPSGNVTAGDLLRSPESFEIGSIVLQGNDFVSCTATQNGGGVSIWSNDGFNQSTYDLVFDDNTFEKCITGQYLLFLRTDPFIVERLTKT